MAQIQSTSELPAISSIIVAENGQRSVKLSGHWTLNKVVVMPILFVQIKKQAVDKDTNWDLTGIELLDSAAGLLIWKAWGQRMPDASEIRPEHQRLFERWQHQELPNAKARSAPLVLLWRYLNKVTLEFLLQCLSVVNLLGQLFLDLTFLLRHPGVIPWSEISITIYDAGVRALGITALVGFLIGIVLSYLSALQLKMFGAEIYIIPILGLSIIRELGPLLAAILVAGRSGSAMTAQIGIMRVTEELDALAALGISHSLRLVFPKVVALAVVLPLLSMWTNSAALLGGMLAAQNTLDIGLQQFFLKLPSAVPLTNVFIGLGKSTVFGLAIALIACHFGFRIKPNTESLGNETTNSVVASITIVMMLDAVFAILFMNVGMP